MSPTVAEKMESLKLSDNECEDRNTAGTEKKVRKPRRIWPELTAVIMAAGSGSRLFELTRERPKCLIPICNTPMIWYPINLLLTNKFEEIIIVVKESEKRDVEQYIHKAFNARSDASFDFMAIDDDCDFGTAHSLRNLISKTKSDLLVISCDTLTETPLYNLANVHRAMNSAITCLMSDRYTSINDIIKKVNKNDERDFIGVDPSDNRLVFISNEKDIEDELCLYRGQLSRFPHLRLYTNLVDAHTYIISRDALKHLETHLSISMIRCELLPLLVRKQIKQMHDVKAAFSDQLYDVSEGDEEGVERFNILHEPLRTGCFMHHTKDFCVRLNSIHNYIAYNKAVFESFSGAIPKGDITTCKISQMTQVGKDSVLGDYVSIDSKCSIKRSFVGSNSSIGANCKISDCVIFDNVTIEDGVTLHNSIICRAASIRSKASLKDCRIGELYVVQSGSALSKEILSVDDDNMILDIENGNDSTDSDESFQSK